MRALVMAGLAALTLSSAAGGQQSALGGFSIELSFSARAAAELARRNEGVTVSVFYDGEPRPAFRRRASEDGLISLGAETIAVPDGSRRVAVSGAAFQAARQGWVIEPMATVNVFSARRSGPDNILDCALVSGRVAELSGRTHPVRCAMIGEQP